MASLKAWRAAIVTAVLLALPGRVLAQGGETGGTDFTDITKRPVDELVRSLDGPNGEIAERELARRGQASVSPLLALLAGSPSAGAHAAAVRVLRKVADPGAADALLRVYRNTQVPVDVRCEAALALGESKVKAIVPALVDGLADTSSLRVCEAARFALEAMAATAGDAIVDAYLAERAKGKASRDDVLFRLMLVLGKVGGPRALDALVAALKTNEKDDPRAVAFRHHAAVALGTTDDRLAIGPLVDALEMEKQGDVAKFMGRSLVWLTKIDMPPYGRRWRVWWETNKAEILNPKNRYNPLPKEGLPKDDK
jgi:hypothetical protein